MLDTAASREVWSLLLLALFPGTGGARLPGALGIPPGIGGAPPNGEGPGPFEVFPTWGADRSFVTVFLSALPFEMSERSAPYNTRQPFRSIPADHLDVLCLPLRPGAAKGGRPAVEAAAEEGRPSQAWEEAAVVVEGEASSFARSRPAACETSTRALFRRREGCPGQQTI